MVKTIEKIAFRESEGNILAEGTERAAKVWGHPEIAMTVKGQAIPAFDPRGLKGMGIGYAITNRGACHLRAYTPAAELNLMPFRSVSVDALVWEGKAKLTILFQDIYSFTDSLDLCKFSSFAEGTDEYARQYSAIVGIQFTSDDVLKTSERVYDLERYYNNLAGIGEGSDTLPARFINEPSTMPGSKGHICEIDKMLAECSEARGWEDGVVPIKKLKELETI